MCFSPAGGKTELENCQILQTQVNRWKGAKEKVDAEEQRKSSCAVTFSEREMDALEMAWYGGVNRVGLKCKCRTIGEMEAMLGYSTKWASAGFNNYKP